MKQQVILSYILHCLPIFYSYYCHIPNMLITNIFMFLKLLHINVNAFSFSLDYPVHKKPEIEATNYLASVSTEIIFISWLLVYLNMSTHTSALFSLTLNKLNMQIPHPIRASPLETTYNYVKHGSLW